MDKDRQRGIVTRKDRKYLVDQVLEGSRQLKYQRKKDVRERIKNGILDFPFIRFLPPKERREIFAKMQPGDDLYFAFAAAISVAKYACDDADLPFDELLEEGIELGTFPARGDLTDPDESPHFPGDKGRLGKTGRMKILRDVDVEITYKYSNSYFPDQLRRRFLEGQDLTDEELLMLVKSDVFDEEVAEELQERESMQLG